MINRIVKLIDIKQFDIFYEDISINENDIIIKPDYLSICAADMRYYTGQRNHKILKKKLPLSLIHEATGTVLVDAKNKIGIGKKVIMIPNTHVSDNSIIKGNYQIESKFRSSDIDGFMQDFIVTDYDRLIEITSDDTNSNVYVLSELMSIAVNAVENYKLHNNHECRKIGVWGDGSLGFVTVIVLKNYFPDAEIYLFGHNQKKMLHYMIADHVIDTENIKTDIQLDCAFECVGGRKSAVAIDQCTEFVRPQGCISLMGVSEDPILMNTRMILERGVTLLGNSRSERSDFLRAVNMIDESKEVRTHLRTIISEIKNVASLEDVYTAFECAQVNVFKTIMKWGI